jgi:FADH2 O2-dependent halogenase
VERVKLSGVDYFEKTEITSLVRRDTWTATLAAKNALLVSVKASLFIDATGNANLVRDALGVQTYTGGFETDSFAVFSHFEDLPRWRDHVVQAGVPMDDYPYDPDDSALHQVIDEGWVWMLRFNNRHTSVGLALANTQQYAHMPTEQIWRDVLSRYPSLWKLIGDATMSPVPGGLVRSARLQRRLTTCCGEGWVALPHSAGFIDPLHSTGIALSLSGIEKLLPILINNRGNERDLQESLRGYERSVFAEIALIDKIVAGCYRTFKHFELFSTWTMMYFIAAVTYEQSRIRGEQTASFLCADNAALMTVINDSYADLVQLLNTNDLSYSTMRNFTQTVKERIHPFNIPGLLDERHRNMYRHAAAVF